MLRMNCIISTQDFEFDFAVLINLEPFLRDILIAFIQLIVALFKGCINYVNQQLGKLLYM